MAKLEDGYLGNVVSLVKSGRSATEVSSAVDEALHLIGFEPSPSTKSVVIKPNLCYYWNATTGYTTDPLVAGALIDWVRSHCNKDVDIKIAEADATAMRTKYVFKVLGYEKLAEQKNVGLVNLSNDVLIDKNIRVNGHELSFKIPEILLKSDLVINVPKLKIMRATKITCAMKNVFGANGVVKKIAYHSLLDEAIVGMNMLVHPNVTVVDGLVGLGKYPKRLDLILASVDGFSVDWIVSRIAGYDPSSVTFLKIAMKEKLGNSDGITTKGGPVEYFAQIFPKEGTLATKRLWAIQFWLLKTYHRLSGDIIPPILEEP
jgi:uncharacterized protein (DUF362 family)